VNSRQTGGIVAELNWRPGKRDLLFLGIVAAVVLLLVLGTSERTTKAVPSDDTHRQATSRAACMECHNASGVQPMPPVHTQADQCFQCHKQPEGWMGNK